MRRLRRPSLVGLLLAAVAVAVLAGCGSDSDSDEAKETASTTVSTVKASRGGDFCKRIAATYNQALSFAGTTARSPDELRQQLETTLKGGQETLDEAPDEVKGDLQVIQDAVRKFSDALAKVGYDATRLGAEGVAIANEFASPQFQQAATRSQAYMQEHCGLDLQPTTTNR